MTDKKSETIEIDVDDVGKFVFRRRTMKCQFRIAAEQCRLTEGVTITDEDHKILVNSFETLRVLTVSAPAGWSLDDADPFEPETYRRIAKVWSALRAHEEKARAA